MTNIVLFRTQRLGSLRPTTVSLPMPNVEFGSLHLHGRALNLNSRGQCQRGKKTRETFTAARRYINPCVDVAGKAEGRRTRQTQARSQRSPSQRLALGPGTFQFWSGRKAQQGQATRTCLRPLRFSTPPNSLNQEHVLLLLDEALF